jgi:hypothetical protein
MTIWPTLPICPAVTSIAAYSGGGGYAQRGDCSVVAQ